MTRQDAMKEALRNAGVPCAQSTRAESAQDARDFTAVVGFPVIIKPPAGAGALIRLELQARNGPEVRRDGSQRCEGELYL